MHKTPIEDFSSGYYVVDADVTPYSGDTVITPNEMMRDFMSKVEFPLLKIGNRHYWPNAEAAVPQGTIAIPDFIDASADEVLLAKQETAVETVLRGG